MPNSPASAGPRVSDEELARLVRHTEGTLTAVHPVNKLITHERLVLDLRDDRTALAAANARIAVLEAAVEAIITEYQDYCADKHMDTSESMYAMYELALATLATASPEPGAAHE